MDDDISMTQQDGVPYAVVTLERHLPALGERPRDHGVALPRRGGLRHRHQDDPHYDLDLHEGSTVLDAEHPSFTTAQSTLERFWEFFRLGAEHLLTGIDHILFLLALIVGRGDCARS